MSVAVSPAEIAAGPTDTLFTSRHTSSSHRHASVPPLCALARSLARRREYGLHTIDLQRLNADVAGVRVRKLKSRLVVALVKAGRGRGGYGRTSPWTKLQADPDKPSD